MLLVLPFRVILLTTLLVLNDFLLGWAAELALTFFQITFFRSFDFRVIADGIWHQTFTARYRCLDVLPPFSWAEFEHQAMAYTIEQCSCETDYWNQHYEPDGLRLPFLAENFVLGLGHRVWTGQSLWSYVGTWLTGWVLQAEWMEFFWANRTCKCTRNKVTFRKTYACRIYEWILCCLPYHVLAGNRYKYLVWQGRIWQCTHQENILYIMEVLDAFSVFLVN